MNNYNNSISRMIQYYIYFIFYHFFYIFLFKSPLENIFCSLKKTFDRGYITRSFNKNFTEKVNIMAK
jgi:hypothetical protein